MMVYVQAEYPKYTPMLAKFLEGLLSGASDHGKHSHYQEASKYMFTCLILALYILFLFSVSSSNVSNTVVA